MPMVDLIEQCRLACEELIDITGRAAIEAVLQLSASQAAGGPAQQGKRRIGDVVFYPRPSEPLARRIENVMASHLADVLFVKEQSSMDEILDKLRPDVSFISAKQILDDNRPASHLKLAIPLVQIPYTDDVSTTQLLSKSNLATNSGAKIGETVIELKAQPSVS
jgi:hypothetical protein